MDNTLLLYNQLEKCEYLNGTKANNSKLDITQLELNIYSAKALIFRIHNLQSGGIAQIWTP